MSLVVTLEASGDDMLATFANGGTQLLKCPVRIEQYGITQTKGNIINNFYLLIDRKLDTVRAGLSVTDIGGVPFTGTFDELGDRLCAFSGGGVPVATENFIFVDSKSKLPTPAAGIITLLDEYTYYFTKNIDLTGDRIVGGQDSVILGASSENATISSTGLGATALLTITKTMPIRHVTFTADIALDIDALGTGAFDWTGVNFLDCAAMGTIKNVDNIIFTKCAILNSCGLTFDGTCGTIAFSESIFVGQAAGTIITIAATAVITRRFRIIYSAMVVFAAATGLDVNVLATIPNEGYILDNVNFSGGATYTAGFTNQNNETRWVENRGITNTSVQGQVYMQGNATATVIADTVNFFKVAGTTITTAATSNYTGTNNRLTNAAAIDKSYMVQATISFNAGNNNICEFGIYDSVGAAVRVESVVKSTANSAGRSENVTTMTIVPHANADFIEVWCKNGSATTNITVTELNLILLEIN